MALLKVALFGATETGPPQQITFRQPAQKVCVQQFHGEDKTNWIFQVFLNLYGSRIMHE